MYRFACTAVTFSILFWSVGCTPESPKAPPLAKVSGTATLDGKAMSGGEVRLAVPGQPPKIIEIKDGAFSGEAFVGKNVVEVYLAKDGPPSTTDPKTPTKINAVDAKFTGPNSALKSEVTKDGPNEFKYEVTSSK